MEMAVKKKAQSSRLKAETALKANVNLPATSMSALLVSANSAKDDCEGLNALASSIVADRCEKKFNTLPHCEEHDHKGCDCSGGGGSGSGGFKADVIILIDTSGSMGGVAKQVSDAAVTAIATAKAKCPGDVKVTFMGVEGTWPATNFATDYLVYLKTLHNPDPVFSTDTPNTQYGQEEGANAIEDLSKYYDWRPGACRAIFYVSDEELDSISPLGDVANEALAVSKAVTAANANKVSVFAHHLTYQNRGPSVIQNYKDLCNGTGGIAYFSSAPSVAEYEKILTEAICSACGIYKCEEAELPSIKPCVSIRWGDSKCDCFESDDLETVCVTICNCYSNITFANLQAAAIFVTDMAGNLVDSLPDGTPSIQITPLGPICFGDLKPCKDDKPTCVSREFVIRSRGAKSGTYRIQIAGLCYDVVSHFKMDECFKLEVCKD
jgi:hypothetical protein